MRIDPDAMAQIAQEAYEFMVVQQHGSPGGEALRTLIQVVRTIYAYVDPSIISGTLTVFCCITPGTTPFDAGLAIRLQNLEMLSKVIGEHCTVQVLDNSELIIWRDFTPDAAALSADSVVYVYTGGKEHFLARTEAREVRKLVQGFASMFAIPTFSELREALQRYALRFARFTTCHILKDIWFDQNRIFLREKPEYLMRRSIAQFLRCTLSGDVDVWEEQNVDESHPIDIQVTWSFSKQMALIEIKWLGKSKHGDGTFATPYTQSRARDGARQLAEYLDSNPQRAPVHQARGFLVVIDARRRGADKDTVTITRENGFHYEFAEVEYNPEFHQERPDFEVPLRMFLAPVCAG